MQTRNSESKTKNIPNNPSTSITHDEIIAACLADHSYTPTKPLPNDCTEWKVVTTGHNKPLTIEENGLSATIYVNEKNEYTVGFRGTTLSFRNLIMHDRSLALGSLHPDCEAFVLKVLNNVPKSNKIQFVGHSLGASMATYASLSTGHSAIVIDSPGVGENIRKRFRDKDWSKITAIQSSPNLVNIINRDKVNIKRLCMPGSEQQKEIMDRNPSSTLGFLAFNIIDFHDRKNIIKAMQSSNWFEQMHQNLVKTYGEKEAKIKLHHLSGAILQSIHSNNELKLDSKYNIKKFPEFKDGYGKNIIKSLEKIKENHRVISVAQDHEHKEIHIERSQKSISGIVSNLETVIKPFGDISQICYQLGTITGKRDLQKIAIAASNLQQIGSAVPSLISAFSSSAPLMAINPAFAILMAGAGIIGMFAKKRKSATQSRPDPHLEAMAQMTHTILTEVHSMWNAMDKEFAALHNENREIFKLIQNGFLHLEALFKGEITYLSHHMDTLFNELQNSIERAQALILNALQENYLKSFHESTLAAKNLIEGVLPGKKAEGIISKLFRYTQNGGLLSKSFLSGADVAEIDSSIPLQDSVKKVTFPHKYVFSEEKTPPLLGYLAVTAKRIFKETLQDKIKQGSNIEDDTIPILITSYLDNPFSSFDNKIVNPDLWMHGALYYAILKNHFGDYVKNSHPIEVSLVSETGHNLLLFIDKVRFSGLFNILFNRYQETLNNIVKLINDSIADENQTMTKNAKSETAIDITHLDASLTRCNGKIPSSSIIDLNMKVEATDVTELYANGANGWFDFALQRQNLYYGSYPLSTGLPDINSALILGHLGCGKIFFDYQVKISFLKINESRPLGTADLTVSFSDNEKKEAKKLLQVKYDIKPEKNARTIRLDFPTIGGSFNLQNADPIVADYYDEIKDYWYRTCNCQTLTDHANNHKKSNDNNLQPKEVSLFKKFEQKQVDYTSEYKDILAQTKNKLSNIFLHHRKQAINTLFNSRMKQCKELQNFCEEIDSLRYLLITYGYLAGLTPEEMGLLNALWKGNDINDHLRFYCNNATYDTPLPHTNLVPHLNRTKDVILDRAINPFENKFQGAVESKVMAALMNLSILQRKENCHFHATVDDWIDSAKDLIEKYRRLIQEFWEAKWLKEWFRKLPAEIQAEYKGCSSDFKNANDVLSKLSKKLEKQRLDFDSILENMKILGNICDEIQINFSSLNAYDIKQYTFNPNLSNYRKQFLELQKELVHVSRYQLNVNSSIPTEDLRKTSSKQKIKI